MSDQGREDRERESLGDTIDGAARRISTAFLIAGAAVALAIYARPGPPRYEVDVSGSTVFRTDIRSGTVIACEGQSCYRVVRRGQRLVDGPAEAVPQPEARTALPAPAAAPAAPTVNGQ